MTTRGRLRAILFDMDGTLLDSEKVWDVALDDLATWLGGSLSQTARHRMVGSSLARSISIMHADLDVEADPESSGAYLLSRTEELFHTDLVWKPGAEKLLQDTRASGLAAALVTSTHRNLTEVALETIGRHYFQASVCGDEVGQPKPHAEPYLRAAALLGVDIADCIAIEDSPLGIAAAEASGAVVIAVPSEVAVEAATTRTILPTLDGVTVAQLDSIFQQVRARS